MMDKLRGLATRVGWQPAAAVALLLLWQAVIWRTPGRRLPPINPTEAVARQHQSELVPRPEPAEATNASEYAHFSQYENITRVPGRDDEELLLLTFPFPDADEGIKCVDAATGRVKWQKDPVFGGRYTYVEAGKTTLVECTGYPAENHLAVRRLSDGAILGRPWTLGRIYDYAISGRRVATVEPVVVQHGREIPVADLGETLEGQEATRVRVYDEWGHVISSMRVVDRDGSTRLIGFPRGFAITSSAETTILTRSGRRVATIR